MLMSLTIITNSDCCKQKIDWNQFPIIISHFFSSYSLPTSNDSCVECQSRYFDCEFDQNDNDTRQDHSDGGLGAGNFNYGTVCDTILLLMGMTSTFLIDLYFFLVLFLTRLLSGHVLGCLENEKSCCTI